jgi:hypothetical protein
MPEMKQAPAGPVALHVGAGKYSAIWLPLRMRENDVTECCQVN